MCATNCWSDASNLELSSVQLGPRRQCWLFLLIKEDSHTANPSCHRLSHTVFAISVPAVCGCPSVRVYVPINSCTFAQTCSCVLLESIPIVSLKEKRKRGDVQGRFPGQNHIYRLRGIKISRIGDEFRCCHKPTVSGWIWSWFRSWFNSNSLPVTVKSDPCLISA